MLREVRKDEFLGDWGDAQQAGLPEVAFDVVLLSVSESPESIHCSVSSEESRFGAEVLSLICLTNAGLAGIV